MPNKMTDNEIIKALECCISSSDCKGCPSYIEKDDDCLGIKWLSILDLINRQKAEIERLSILAKLGNMRANDYRTMRDRALKAEKEVERLKVELFDKTEQLNFIAIYKLKEFAERLNKEAEKVAIDREGDFVETNDKIYDTVANWCKATSDNLLKEMVGEDNEN